MLEELAKFLSVVLLAVVVMLLSACREFMGSPPAGPDVKLTCLDAGDADYCAGPLAECYHFIYRDAPSVSCRWKGAP